MNASAEQEETQKQADKLKATLKVRYHVVVDFTLIFYFQIPVSQDAIISGDGEMREYDDDDEDLDDGIPSVGYRPGVGSKTTTVYVTRNSILHFYFSETFVFNILHPFCL